MDHERPDPIRKDAWAAKVHVWGAICEEFYCLVILGKNVDAEDYVDTLEKHFLPHLVEHGGPENFILMQDNASSHTAELTTDWLQEKKLEVMPWPPYSPDLNPIENLWAIMKQRLEVNCFHKRADVEAEIIRVWAELTPTTVSNLVASFPRRLDQLEEAKGDDIKMVR